MQTNFDSEYVTVAEAASLFRVSQSTIWRWINEGRLAAYRFGQRRVLLKRRELERLLSPARGEVIGEAHQSKQAKPLVGPLTPEQKERWLLAIEEARRSQQEILQRRQGRLFPSSHEIIDELRRQRSGDQE